MKHAHAPGRSRRPRLPSLLACLAVLAAPALRADNWSPNLTTSGTWHSNASNADTSFDEVDSLQLAADLVAAQQYHYGALDTLQLGLHGGADWWPRYHGLSGGISGARAEWQHSFGTDPRALAVSLEGSADAVIANDRNRRGTATAVMLALRKRIDELTRVTLAHDVSWLDARAATYDRSANETSLAVDRDLSNVTRFTFTARFRDGDVVTHAMAPRADLAALASHQLDVMTFGRPMTAYRIDAQTWSARGALSRALDQSSAVVLAYEWRTTKHHALSFVNHQLSIALVHQF